MLSSPLFPLRLPAVNELVGHPEVIEHARHDGVHDLFDALRSGVERRVGREDGCAGLDEEFEVLHVDEV